MQGAACGRRPDHGSLPEAKKITNVSHVRVDLGEWLPALVVAHGDPMLRGTMVSSPQVLLRPTIMRRLNLRRLQSRWSDSVTARNCSTSVRGCKEAFQAGCRHDRHGCRGAA